MLAEVINFSFLDADDCHSQYNKGIVLFIYQYYHSVIEVYLIPYNN